MTRDEARALLVEQGTLMLQARIKASAAREQLEEARAEWVTAAMPLVKEEFLEHGFTLAEEEQCLLESIEQTGHTPEEFPEEISAFRRMRGEQIEEQLQIQRNYAGLN